MEDAEEIRDVVGAALQTAGYSVKAAGDGEEGLKLFDSFSPHLVLLDIRLPNMDGLRLLEILRQITSVPILMYSAVSDRAQIARAIQKGADDYVLKTVGVEEAVSRIEKHLGPADRPMPGGSEKDSEGAGARPLVKTGRKKVQAVLVSHPDDDARSEIVKNIERFDRDLHVIECSSGEGAIEAVAQAKHPIRLMVLSWEQPDMNASYVLKALRKRKAVSFGVIVVGEKNSPEIQRRAYYDGAMDYVPAPFDDGRVEIAVSSAFAKINAARERAIRKKRAELARARNEGAA